jgi:hypothetical protein
VVSKAELLAHGAEDAAAIPTAVVHQEPVDPDPAGREPAVSQREEGRGAGRRFVGKEGGVGQAGPIIDRDGQELRADAPAAPAVIPVNAVAHSTEAAQLLDIQVHELAGDGPLIPLDRGRCWPRDPRQTQAPLDVDHRRHRQLQVSRNAQ